MTIQYDEKGKFFTQTITKLPVQVIIHTGKQIIRGEMHVRPGTRIKDELNSQEKFLAVTNAIIYNLQNEEDYRTSLVVINASQIVWVIPEEEQKPQ